MIQSGLGALKLDAGPADGLFGPKTRAAIRDWQRAKGLAATGYLTSDQSETLVAQGKEVRVAVGLPAPPIAVSPSPPKPETLVAKQKEVRVAVGLPSPPVSASPSEPKPEFLPGETFKDCPECPEMVVVPAGSFMMGSLTYENSWTENEGPQHRVTIAKRFAVGKFEVTFDEWDACVADGGCGGHRPEDRGWGRGRRPVIKVHWEDTKSYVSWLSRKTGKQYSLLSESEWEYVARAGTTTRYAWGDDIGHNKARCIPCGWGWDLRTAPVGSFEANGFGLHDMHGNVKEWVDDCYNDSYSGAPSDGRAWITSGDCQKRVTRGGSWYSNRPGPLRSASRDAYYIRSNRRDDYGFRIARTLN